jgi:tetratricopeptide (TPR) repeat protein
MAGEARRIYGMLRQYDRAERYLERWAATRSSQFQEMPTFLAVYYYYRAELMLKRDGNVDAARELLEQAQEPTGLDYWELVTNLDKPYTRVMCVHEIDACREGLRHATYRDGGVDDVDYYMTMADLYRWVEDEDHSRAYYDSAATANRTPVCGIFSAYTRRTSRHHRRLEFCRSIIGGKVQDG